MDQRHRKTPFYVCRDKFLFLSVFRQSEGFAVKLASDWSNTLFLFSYLHLPIQGQVELIGELARGGNVVWTTNSRNYKTKFLPRTSVLSFSINHFLPFILRKKFGFLTEISAWLFSAIHKSEYT